ncbi:MAG: tyrosine-protein phosphatase [Phycisphaerales bacterium]|nr:tyrosine-protein phosphatase [Phycisphaerales bacterium]
MGESQPKQTCRRSGRISRTGLILTFALVAAAGGVGAWIYHDSRVPKRFGTVEDGRLYRSGEITPRQLKHLAETYGIQTVLSLLDPEHPRSKIEKAAAEELGLLWVCVPLPGDGASTAEQRKHIREIVLDDSLGPTLVHCAAGANRTGLAVGMYRIHHDGWTTPRVLEEMRTYDFEDEPKHENLRAALEAEYAEAHPGQGATSKPTSAPNGTR